MNYDPTTGTTIPYGMQEIISSQYRFVDVYEPVIHGPMYGPSVSLDYGFNNYRDYSDVIHGRFSRDPDCILGSSSSKSENWASQPGPYDDKVTPEFKQKLQKIAEELQVNPDYLMAAMAFETGETFSPSVKNPGSSATGLIQFMESTAKGLGTTTEALSKMTAIEQLDYVKKHFEPYKGRLNSVEDVYMAILYPSAIGKVNSHVMFEEGKDINYDPNKGLDKNKDGKITKEEAAAEVKKKLDKIESFKVEKPSTQTQKVTEQPPPPPAPSRKKTGDEEDRIPPAMRRKLDMIAENSRG